MPPRLTITNPSSFARRAQCIATVPQAAIPADATGKEWTLVTDTGQKWRAVYAADRGTSHRVFRICATMDGSQSVEGTLVNTPHPDSKEQEMTWHPWVNDDPMQ